MKIARFFVIAGFVLSAFIAFWLLNQRRTAATNSPPLAGRDLAANWLTLE